MTKLLQQCFLFFIVVVILGHNLGNSQVSVYRTIGPTLVFGDVTGNTNIFSFGLIIIAQKPTLLCLRIKKSINRMLLLGLTIVSFCISYDT